ncbi:porin [Microvirga brassicacearum]|uniref:Porin n=1 Tax=Microvirga brassicacearum TaxID=2580413 RepID=A0A5N3PHL4_9HYPH|nr:porin [Microvirga brassicacearum]KAB0269135.1 porin [Microvirga brassicacearum]
MPHLRSLIIGSAAGLAVVTGTQAADLPIAKAAPVEYVRVCSTYGQGFFYIPGTETCLRIGGRVRADYLYAEPFTRAQDITGFRARGRLNLDTRTMTAYGLLRSYIRYEIDRNSGAFASPGEISTNPKINQAYVQFGGLTAGRVTSFFSDSELPAPNFGDLRFDDPTNADVDLLAYTFSFGNGFSATLSLEDALERRVNNPLVFPLFGVGAAAPLPFNYGGQRVPDVVANLRYTGTWGSVQLSSALHQIRDVAAGVTTVDGVVVPVLNPLTGLPNPTFADTDYGFAIALNTVVKLPFLGEADTAWISATYTDGAVGYINAGQAGPINEGVISAGPLALPFADAFVDPFTGEFKTNKAYGVAGGLNHNWNRAFATNIFGSWMRFDAPAGARFIVPANAATITAGTAGTATGLLDFNEYRIGTNTIWTPVTGLQIGVEVLYTRVDPRGRVAVPLTTAAGESTGFFKSTGSADSWESRLRIQRDF